MKKKVLILLFFAGLIFVINYGIWNVFFQQDEWFWFGRAVIIQKEGISAILKLSGFHFTPLSVFSFYFFYTFFSLHWQIYALYTLSLHSLNAFLLFYLVKKVFKNTCIAFLSALFFVIANVSQQAVTWYGASLAVVPMLTFGLLSLSTFFRFYQVKKKKYLILSYLFLFIGLGFKEDILSLFIVYGLCFLCIKKIKSKRALIFNGITGLIYILSHGLIEKFGMQNPLSHIDPVSYFLTIGTNIILIPLKSFSQLYFSPLMVYNLGHFVTQGHEEFFLLFSPIKNIDIFIETIFFTIVTISLTIIFLILLGLMIKVIKKEEQKKVALLLLFISLSFSAFFLLPKGFGMESRHYYFPVIGASVLLGYVVSFLWEKVKYTQYKYLLLIFFALYFGYNFLLDKQQVDQVIGLSVPRISFIEQIQKRYRYLPQHAVVLSQAEVLPFQSGMGQMLMVLYNNNYQFNSLLESNVLWDMGSQGYKRIGKESFGYFSDVGLLRDTYVHEKVPLSHVYSFSWNNTKMILTDTSKITRKELSNNE